MHVNTCPIFQFLLRSPANASQTSKSCLHYDTFAFLRNASLSILGHTVRLRRRPLVFHTSWRLPVPQNDHTAYATFRFPKFDKRKSANDGRTDGRTEVRALPNRTQLPCCLLPASCPCCLTAYRVPFHTRRSSANAKRSRLLAHGLARCKMTNVL